MIEACLTLPHGNADIQEGFPNSHVGNYLSKSMKYGAGKFKQIPWYLDHSKVVLEGFKLNEERNEPSSKIFFEERLTLKIF